MKSEDKNELTFEFVNEVHDLKINSGNFLVSYDVSSLFTNVPLDETISILADKAFTNDWFNETHGLHLTKQDLVDLLRGATKAQLFLFNGPCDLFFCALKFILSCMCIINK